MRRPSAQTRDAYLGVIAEKARVKALQQSVKSNQTALEATEAGFEVGTRTTVDVLDARRRLFEAQTQLRAQPLRLHDQPGQAQVGAGTLAARTSPTINGFLTQPAPVQLVASQQP